MIAADWADAFTGIGPRGVPESDQYLRNRVLYVAGDCDREVNRISQASGQALDEIADEFGLKRRFSASL